MNKQTNTYLIKRPQHIWISLISLSDVFSLTLATINFLWLHYILPIDHKYTCLQVPGVRSTIRSLGKHKDS